MAAIYDISLKDNLSNAIKTAQANVLNFEKALDRINNKGVNFKGLNSQTAQANTGFKNLIGTVSGVVAAVGAFAGVKSIIGLASDAEQSRIAFNVMLGDVEKGGKMIEDLKKEAKSTPFSFTDLEKNGKLMLNFGIESEKVIPTLRMLGDVSLGNKDKLAGLSLAYSQIQSTGRLMGQDLLQLINAGFNPLQVISKQTGRSMKDLKKDMENGAISAKMVEDAFKTVTSEGGMFYQMMEKQSKTFAGRWAALQDVIEQVGASMGNKILPVLGSIVDFASESIDFLKENITWVGELFRPLQDAIQPIFDLLDYLKEKFGLNREAGSVLYDVFNAIGKVVKTISPVIKFFADLIAGITKHIIDNIDFYRGLAIVVGSIAAAVWIANTAVVAFTTVLGIWKTFTLAATIAQLKLNFALIANPIGLVITAVVGLIAGLVLLYQKTEAGRGFFTGFFEGFKATFLGVAKLAKQILGGVGDMIEGVLNKDFSQIKKGLGSVVLGVHGYDDKGNNIITDVKNAYQKGNLRGRKEFQDEKEDERREDKFMFDISRAKQLFQQQEEDKKRIAEKEGITLGKPIATTTSKSLGEKEKAVGGMGSNKVSQIHIQTFNLVKELTLSNTDINSNETELVNKITKALNKAWNDFQIMQG